MMRDYELMYIVRPDLDEDALRAAARSVRGLIEAQGGEVVKTTLWGKRRLAYEVNRLRDGSPPLEPRHQGVVHDLLRDGPLAAVHHRVDELRHQGAVVEGIRVDLPLRHRSATWHLVFLA